jgi:hypothetical protein
VTGGGPVGSLGLFMRFIGVLLALIGVIGHFGARDHVRREAFSRVYRCGGARYEDTRLDECRFGPGAVGGVSSARSCRCSRIKFPTEQALL